MTDKPIIDEVLDKQYRSSKWAVRTIPDGKNVVQYFLEIGQQAKETAVKDGICDLDIRYGDGTKTKLDVYYPKDKSKTLNHDILIFIHGGYWQEASKDDYAFFASQVKAWDVVLVMVGYDLAPSVSIDDIVKQIKQAVTFVAQKFPDSRLFLFGHSAGGHLSAMMLNTDWEDDSIKTRLSGACLMSGIYDLVPIVSTSINEPLKLDKEAAIRNSPMNITASGGLKVHCKVLFIVGEHDSPAFRKQTKDYCQLLKQNSINPTHMEIPFVDHFDLLEKCLEEDYCLNQAIYKFLKE